MGVDALREYVQTLEELTRRRARNRLAEYLPYPKQMEFHAAGADHRERLFMAGNRLGKTQAGAYEMAMHLTGRYPEGWPGRRFDHPIQAWASGITGETTRDVVQEKLLGPPASKEDWGTGAIPGDDIVTWSLARGMADAVDQLVVKHVSGGHSFLGFKTYEKGREKWQGARLHVVWFDEEAPIDIYTEGLTRTVDTGGMAYMTATPLLGMSDVVTMFYPSPKMAAQHLTRMEIEDALHLPAEKRQEIIDSYPVHERDVRLRGIPMLGSGRIFDLSEEAITVAPFQVPDWYRCIGGLDFGWDHPSAAVKIAHDPDDDIIYVTQAHKAKNATPVMFAAGIKAWGLHATGRTAAGKVAQWLPWAWPHDGHQHDKGSGEELAGQYRKQGLLMLPEHATHEEGGYGLEAGLMLMLDYMLAGRFKVFAHLGDWFDEFRMYHRKEGRVVKERDDLMSATRAACTSLRFAKPPPSGRRLMPSRYRTDQLLFD